jgi:hypothetical protein
MDITTWNPECIKTHKRTTQVLTKGKPLLLLIRHPPCYSYIQLSPVKLFAVIEERKHLRKKEKIHCHLRYVYSVTVDCRFLCSDDFNVGATQPCLRQHLSSVQKITIQCSSSRKQVIQRTTKELSNYALGIGNVKEYFEM